MKDSEQNFTDKLKELEQLTAWFEADEVDLDQALTKFERGMELATELKDQLTVIENKVEKIKQKFSQGAKPVEEAVSEEPPELFDE